MAFTGWSCCLIIGCVAIPHIYTAVKVSHPHNELGNGDGMKFGCHCADKAPCHCVACHISSSLRTASVGCSAMRLPEGIALSIRPAPAHTDLPAAPQWYYLLVTFMIVPFFSIANSYTAGLTDQDNSSIYGKLAILIFAAWAGTSGGGVIAGLGICGVVVAATSQAAVLMQVRLQFSATGHAAQTCRSHRFEQDYTTRSQYCLCEADTAADQRGAETELQTRS